MPANKKEGVRYNHSAIHLVYESNRILQHKPEGLPKRCPILNRCMRRAWTIFFFSYTGTGPLRAGSLGDVHDILIANGEMAENFRDTQIDVMGELPTYSRGGDYMDYFHMCPEVTLFAEGHRPLGVSAIASTSGGWDKLRQGNKFENYQSKHYSECAEFCACAFSKPSEKKRVFVKKNKRPSLSAKLRFTILARDNYTCFYCGHSRDSGIKLHVDHKVSIADGGTNAPENLVTSCEACNLGKGARSVR